MGGNSSRREEIQNMAMLGSLRGNEYQILLTLMAVIKAGILMTQDDAFECNICTEGLENSIQLHEAGKFDDVIFHNTFRAVPRKLNVQAKNRMNGQKVSWKELVERQAKGAFSICKYFSSFMTTKQHHLQGVQHLVLCTNVDLDNKAKSLFETFNFPEACDIFSPLGATCYRFTEDSLKISKEYNTIVRLLKECSDSYNLANLLAAIIYNQKELDLTANNPQRPETALLYKYSHALHSLIGEKRGGSQIHELRENFITGSKLSSNEMQFREAFELAYKHKVDAVWENVKAKGIKVKSKAKNQEGTAETTVCSHFPEDDITNEDIEMFFQQFVLVTNANELAIRIKNILIKSDIIQLQQVQIGWIETDAAFNYLYKIIHSWITLQCDLPAQLEAKNVQDILKKTQLHLQYLNLKNISKDYVNTIKVGKRCIKNDCLMKLPLYEFLKANPSEEDQMTTVFTFYSSYEPRISLLILLETYDLCFDETDHPEFIFIESKKYNEHKQTLQELLSFVDFQLLLIIECEDTTFANQLEQEMISAFQSLEQKFQKIEKKVVIIAQIRENDPFNLGSENSLVLEQFFEESFEHIIPKYHPITIFGTDISLSALMDDQDDVKILVELMEDHNRTIMQRSLIEEHYENIKQWFIQRDFVVLKSPSDNAIARYSEGIEPGVVIPPEYDENNRLDWKSFADCFSSFPFEVNNISDFLNGQISKDQLKHRPPGVCESSTAKVHIFLDEAGVGKTTYLTWLGGYLQNCNKTWWVIRFNSINYSKHFQLLSEGDQCRTMDDTLALRILYQMVHYDLFSHFQFEKDRLQINQLNKRSGSELPMRIWRNNWDQHREIAQQFASLLTISEGNVVVDKEKWKRMKWTPVYLVAIRFFAEQFNNRNLVILFDGFDEVVSHYKEVVCVLLSRLECLEGILKIYLTSRPYNLSQVFKNSAFYRLKPFSDHNIMETVHRHIENTIKEPLKKYEHSEYFLAGLSRSLKHYIGTLCQVPLYLKMALNFISPSIQNHVNFTKGTIDKALLDILQHSLNLLTLIEKCIKNEFAREYERTLLDLTRIDSARSRVCHSVQQRTVRRKHQPTELDKYYAMLLTQRKLSPLALYIMFDLNEQERFPHDQKQVYHIEDQDFKHTFSHQIFVDYLAAFWFYDNRRHPQVQSFIESSSFRESHRKQLRELYENMCREQEDGVQRPSLPADQTRRFVAANLP